MGVVLSVMVAASFPEQDGPCKYRCSSSWEFSGLSAEGRGTVSIQGWPLPGQAADALLVWLAASSRAPHPPGESPGPAAPRGPGSGEARGPGGRAGSWSPSHVLAISRPQAGEGATAGLSVTCLGLVSAPPVCCGLRRPRKGSPARGCGGCDLGDVYLGREGRTLRPEGHFQGKAVCVGRGEGLGCRGGLWDQEGRWRGAVLEERGRRWDWEKHRGELWGERGTVGAGEDRVLEETGGLWDRGSTDRKSVGEEECGIRGMAWRTAGGCGTGRGMGCRRVVERLSYNSISLHLSFHSHPCSAVFPGFSVLHDLFFILFPHHTPCPSRSQLCPQSHTHA